MRTLNLKALKALHGTFPRFTTQCRPHCMTTSLLYQTYRKFGTLGAPETCLKQLVSSQSFEESVQPIQLFHGQIAEDRCMAEKLKSILSMEYTTSRPKVLLVTSLGGHDRHGGYLNYLLQMAGADVVPYTIPEVRLPVEAINDAVEIVKRVGCTSVVGAGGGPIIDIGKLIAAYATNVKKTGSLSDYAIEMQGLKGGLSFVKKSLPFVALPTSMYSGTELTGTSRISDGTDFLCFQSPILRANGVLFDDEILHSLPIEKAVVFGFASLTQNIDIIFDCEDDNIDINALKGVEAAAAGLSAVLYNKHGFVDGNELDEFDWRSACMSAAQYSGKTFSNETLANSTKLVKQSSVDHGFCSGAASSIINLQFDTLGKEPKDVVHHAPVMCSILPELLRYEIELVEGEEDSIDLKSTNFIDLKSGPHSKLSSILTAIANGAELLNSKDDCKKIVDSKLVLGWIDRTFSMICKNYKMPTVTLNSTDIYFFEIFFQNTSAAVSKMQMYDNLWNNGTGTAPDTSRVRGNRSCAAVQTILSNCFGK